MAMMNRQTVLAIDDSLMICKQIEIALKDTGLNVYQSHDGKSALEMVRTHKPDLILLDVVLPDTEGYELIERIQERDENRACIIFLTSKDSEKDVSRGFSLGAQDYIKKPFQAEELRSRVLTHLKEKKKKDDLEILNQTLKENMEKMNAILYRDELTGIYNRRYVTERLLPQLENPSHGHHLVMLDIDDFKKVNDTYGHLAGDLALMCISNIINGVCDEHVVSRWGGEEFLLIFTDLSDDQAIELCEDIRREVEAFPFAYGTLTFYCTVTMGLSSYQKDLELKDNVKHADEALYRGKKSGKNKTVFYDAGTGE